MRQRWWPHALLAAAVMAVYANSLGGPLVYDDRATIIDNQTIEDLWSAGVFHPPHETSVAGRPVVNLTFAINYALGGRTVTGYHVVNVGIHLLCGLALFGIARRAQPPVAVGLAIALLWAVHPLNTEAVDYLTQRTESLMALFYLWTIYCAIRAHGDAGRRARWIAGSIAACALGMGTKESMVTAPVAVLLFDRVFLFSSFGAAARRRWRLYAGLAATWLILAALVAGGPRSLSAGFAAYDADTRTYLLNQAVMIVRYLRLAIWPRDLVVYYGWPVPLTLGAVVPQVLAIVALLCATAWALWRYPRIGFLGAWFFLTLAPTSSLVPIATEVGAERRMYLPLMAVVALAVLGVRRLLPGARVRVAALAVSTILLGVQTIARNAEYGSSLRLAETTVERWPTPAAHSMFGTELAAAGRLAEAEPQLRQAADAHPPARYYLGTVLAAQGRPEDAVAHFRSFIASQPPELDQVRLARRELAASLVRAGRDIEAATEYRAVIAADPGDGQAMVQLAQIALRHQRFDEAIAVLRPLTVLRPSDPWAYGALGIALASTGRLDEAVEAFRRQVDLDPGNEHARQNLARAISMRPR